MKKLLEFQEEAVNSGKKFLFMSTGTGKTFTTLSAIKQRKENGEPIHTIMVFSTKTQVQISSVMKEDWFAEFEDVFGFSPETLVLDNKNYQSINRYDLVLSTHHFANFERLVEANVDLSNVLIVLDEVHKLKNPGKIVRKNRRNVLTGKAGKFAAELVKRAYDFYGLTATPSSGTWQDYANYLIMDNKIPDFRYFKDNFCIVGAKQVSPVKILQNEILGYKREDVLKAMIDNIAFRTGNVEKYTGILIDSNYISFKADKVALKHYESFPLYVTYDGVEKPGLNKSARLHHAKNLASGINKKISPKSKHVFDLLVEEKIGPTILFYSYTEEYDNIIRTLDHYKGIKELSYKVINGKNKDVDFNNDVVDLLIIQHQAGCEGLNMQKYKNIIVYSPPEMYTSYKQALGRNNRLSQKEDITRYFFVNEIEKIVYERLDTKKDFDFNDDKTYQKFWVNMGLTAELLNKNLKKLKENDGD